MACLLLYVCVGGGGVWIVMWPMCDAMRVVVWFVFVCVFLCVGVCGDLM